MAGNAKISDNSVFINTITDITQIDGFAAYATVSGTGNAAMSGTQMVTSLEANLDLTNFTTGKLDIPYGGTGASTAQDAINALSNVSGASVGDVLTESGGNAIWAAPTTGTVTSVAASGGTTGMTWSGSPITTSGTLTLSGTLDVGHGGTGLTTYTIGDIIYADTASTLDQLVAGASAGDVLTTNGAGVAPSWATPTAGTVTSVELDLGTTGLRTTGASSQTITSNGTFDISGTLVIANGGTGITNYGQACEIFLNSATVGPNSLGNSNNNTTYVAPMDTLAFNDDATLYTPVFNTGIFGAANWAGGIQVSQGGKYLVEGQYFSFDGQTPTPGGVQQMEVWAEVNSANNTHSASWPTTATAGDIYLLGGGQTSTTLSGNAGQYGSRIVTAAASDYIRILFRHADFNGSGASNGFPVYTDSFTGPVTGLEGYRVRLTVTRMA